VSVAKTHSGVCLVVEDDEATRDALCTVLASCGYGSVAASNGREALELLRREPTPVCVIILDLMMPVMDGIDFRVAQRQDPRLASIPVVVLSAHPNGQKTAAELGAHGFVAKPVELSSLIDVVQKFC
jgi:CheY-like chemotaxis protein